VTETAAGQRLLADETGAMGVGRAAAPIEASALPVREWLSGQTFADQYELGMDVLNRIEEGIPLP
jgi:hypothetical protein